MKNLRNPILVLTFLAFTICLLTNAPAIAGETTRITFIFGEDATEEVLEQRVNFVAKRLQEAKPGNPVDAITSDGKAVFSLRIDSKNRLKIRQARQKALNGLREFYLQKSKSPQKPTKNDVSGGMGMAVGRFNSGASADRFIMIFLGSGLYWDDYMDLRDGYPSDSMANKDKEDSPYSIIPVNQTSSAIEVIFVTQSTEFKNAKHRNRISRFYSLLCHSRRMMLLGFTPDYEAAASLMEKGSKVQKPVPRADDFEGPLVIYRLDAQRQPVKRVEQPTSSIDLRQAPQTPLGSVLRYSIAKGIATTWVSLRDPQGNILTGLKAEDFQVIETINGQSMQIPPDEMELESVNDRRMAIVLNRDVSPSMSKQALIDSKNAIEDFADHLRPGDIAALVEFHDAPEISCDFSSDPEALKKSIMGCSEPQGTALYDALLLSVYMLRKKNDTLGYIVAFTDGYDICSKNSAADVLYAAKMGSIPIFLVGVADVQENILRLFAEETGGLYVPASDAADLTRIFGDFATLVSNSLVLTYPSSANPGQSVKVDVIVDNGNMRGRLSSTEFMAR